MKRPLTSTGTILCTVIFSILIFGQILSCILLSVASSVISFETSIGGNSDAAVVSLISTLVILSVVSLIIYIICLVLNACSISASSATPKRYKNKKGLLITTAVFNILVFLFSLCVNIFQFVSYFNPFQILSFVVEIGILLGGIFLIVDLIKEKQRVEDYQEEQVSFSPQAPASNEIDSITAELNKLNRLKENGVISDAEYEQLKHKILLKY